MKVRVDPTKCRGYGMCKELAEAEFVSDDWGLVQARGSEVSLDQVLAVQSAIEACPFQAIRLVDEDSPPRISVETRAGE
jgi:ferredoxin